MRRVMIYGAGEAGRMVLEEIEKHPEEKIEVVGFFDDDHSKHGRYIYSRPVIGGRERFKEIVNKYGIDEVIISMPSVKKSEIKPIVAMCKAEKVSLLIVPSTMEIIRGKVRFDQIKEIDLSDLLEREEVNLNREEIKGYIEGKRVLVSGAAGSIGSELVKKIAEFEPEVILALDINESGLFYLVQESKRSYKGVKVVPVIADIKDDLYLKNIFERTYPDIVFHAAAYKHVPLMEHSVYMAFLNNVVGTLNLLEVSESAEIDRLINVSTDKAVYPVSVMGRTKRITELMVKSFAHRGMRSCSVRFGNVLGSNGSVVNIFKDQISRGGPVTITSPRMERYFMTVNEAVSLVVKAGKIGENGDVYVLDMGKPIKIKELAENLIVLSGYIPDVDIKIEYTGIREGERLSERLFYNEEEVISSDYDGIYIERLDVQVGDELNNEIKSIKESLYNIDEKNLVSLMDKLIYSRSALCSSSKIPVS